MKKYIMFFVTGFISVSCHYGHNHDHEISESDLSHKSGEIEISEERQQALGIVSAAAALSDFHVAIQSYGELSLPVSAMVALVSPFDGIVDFKGNPVPGQNMKKGQILATVGSKGLDGGDRLLIARASYEAAKAEFERDSLLLSDRIISASHYEQSLQTYVRAKSEYEALGGRESEAGVVIVAPGKGSIASLEVSQGAFVEKGSVIAYLRDDSCLQLCVYLPQRYLKYVGTISDASISMPDGTVRSLGQLGGHVVSGSASIVDGYIPVMIQLDTPYGLVPGLGVDVVLLAGEARKALMVPVSALVEEQGEYSVFVRLDEDCFQKRSVKIGDGDMKNVEIVSGLHEGEDIVVSGAVQVKLAGVASAPSGHNHSH